MERKHIKTISLVFDYKIIELIKQNDIESLLELLHYQQQVFMHNFLG